MNVSTMTAQPTLVDAIWNTNNNALRNVALAVVGSLALWVSAKIQVPFYPVPMTMQTFMVLVIGMAFGWRLGAAVGSKEALKNLLHVKSNVDSGHFIPAYDAGISAMDNTTDNWLAERNAIYQARRDIIVNNLDDIGLSAITPKASLYIWAKVKDMPALEYVELARQHAHVSLAPGAAYGPGGDDYIRISLTATEDRLQDGMNRLKKWYSNR